MGSFSLAERLLSYSECLFAVWCRCSWCSCAIKLYKPCNGISLNSPQL